MPVITKVLVDYRHTEGVPAWPGVQLHVPSEDASILLGSPIGTIVAFFLVQHKQELGLKHVSSIALFMYCPGIRRCWMRAQQEQLREEVPRGRIAC